MRARAKSLWSAHHELLIVDQRGECRRHARAQAWQDGMLMSLEQLIEVRRSAGVVLRHVVHGPELPTSQPPVRADDGVRS